MTVVAATNPKEVAQALLPSGYEARVLEPSRPAINDGEYKADDPAAVDGRDPSRRLVTPTTAGDVTWSAMAARLPELTEYCSDHWLGAWRRLPALPDDWVHSVVALGQLAFHVLAPARFGDQGKMGLRYTYQGFGTPFFGADRQIRVEGEHLVMQDGDIARREEITTLRDATKLVGIEYKETWGPQWHDPPAATDPDEPLRVDRASVQVCSDIIGFGFSVLEQIRIAANEDENPSRVQLWPEHFDAAVEIGIEGDGRRAGFGVSPGYAAHPEPFVYVSPWAKDWLEDSYWNADSFGGSILRYSDLLAAADQRETALGFLQTGLELLRRR
jgi:hypothetical protein